LSIKTAFNLVKIHLLFRIIPLIQWSVILWYINVLFIKFSTVFSFMRHSIHEIWRDTYFDVIEEWRQRYRNGS
jgi:hypothetical protein